MASGTAPKAVAITMMMTTPSEIVRFCRMIARALRLAGVGDWVAVLGKGHETGQHLADRTVPFDDVDVVKLEWTRIARGADA